MEQYEFTFKGKRFRLTDKWEETCPNDSKQFQLQQFNYLLEVKDYIAMENRVNNQIKFGYLEQI